ncbi:hypothetical protein [Ralstonia holmesii]|uniref:Uncharacterized protein n=2 Tax=Ralstonia holmesii TaxID=3058602 RepID=A0ABC8Q4Z3_9RALS|nr:hypothetical protein [Ralstonia sp. LMG 32967]CAJ0773747.1 hypothetical protein LMG18096_00024 [Ralstonia sp. LMG 32967]CAJ0820131.1 hypothetical protein LMG18093_04263 [Ralstonia sp. LMG 32967]
MVMRFDDSVAALNVHVWVITEHFCDMPVALPLPVRTTLADAQCAAPMRVRELNIVQAAAQKNEGGRICQGRKTARTMAG